MLRKRDRRGRLLSALGRGLRSLGTLLLNLSGESTRPTHAQARSYARPLSAVTRPHAVERAGEGGDGEHLSAEPGGPPSHWLERVRSAGAPAHWLARLEESGAQPVGSGLPAGEAGAQLEGAEGIVFGLDLPEHATIPEAVLGRRSVRGETPKAPPRTLGRGYREPRSSNRGGAERPSSREEGGRSEPAYPRAPASGARPGGRVPFPPSRSSARRAALFRWPRPFLRRTEVGERPGAETLLAREWRVRSSKGEEPGRNHAEVARNALRHNSGEAQARRRYVADGVPGQLASSAVRDAAHLLGSRTRERLPGTLEPGHADGTSRQPAPVAQRETSALPSGRGETGVSPAYLDADRRAESTRERGPGSRGVVVQYAAATPPPRPLPLVFTGAESAPLRLSSGALQGTAEELYGTPPRRFEGCWPDLPDTAPVENGHPTAPAERGPEELELLRERRRRLDREQRGARWSE